MVDLFTAAPDDDDIEDPKMAAWLDEPVYFDGCLVTRRSAYRLCAEQERCWRSLNKVTDLPAAEVPPGVDILSLQAAYSTICLRRPAYRSNPSRDV